MNKGPFDLAIVGAGIIGAMAAYLASQRKPEWNIALIDRSFVGSGATQHSAGLDIPYGQISAKKQLSLESTKIYERLKSDIPGLPVYTLPLFGVVNRARVSEVTHAFARGDLRIASKSEEERLRRTIPDLKVPRDQVLLTGCSCSYSFPQLVASMLVDLFRQHKQAVCWEGIEVQRVEQSENVYLLQTYDGRTIATKRVLVTTGPWLLNGPGAEVAKQAGVRIKKVAALHISHMPQSDDPVLCFFEDDAFLLPIHRRREWLFSFASQEWDCLPEASTLRINTADRSLALSILNRYCRSFASRAHSGRVFCDAYTPDRLPIITQVPRSPDFVVAGACSGSGFRLAPAVAHRAIRQFSGIKNEEGNA